VRDPLATRLKAASNWQITSADKVAVLLAFRGVFPAQLAENPVFKSAVTKAFETLVAHGAKGTVALQD